MSRGWCCLCRDHACLSCRAKQYIHAGEADQAHGQAGLMTQIVCWAEASRCAEGAEVTIRRLHIPCARLCPLWLALAGLHHAPPALLQHAFVAHDTAAFCHAVIDFVIHCRGCSPVRPNHTRALTSAPQVYT